MTRILLTAGKGGVGKSTVAAATAAHCAERGLRSLVMSIDSAHNLSDLFRTPLGPAPVPIGERLWGLEVDVNHEIAANWDAVIDFFRTLTAQNPAVSGLVAEECAVLPGMEEVFGLLRLRSLVETGQWDVVVLDSPPTADLLKFLRLPDVLRWFMEKYQPLERSFLQRMRPVAEALHWPVPSEESLEQMEQWYSRVREASATLADYRHVSVRLVLNPDRVGLAETQRALSWTSLMGMNVDGVVVNKVLPPGPYPPPLDRWPERQAAVLEEAEERFSPLPVLRAELRPDEVLGLETLREFGASLYAERDPAAVWSAEPPLQWSERGTEAELRLRLPFLKKGQFRLLSGEEGLTLLVGSQRRIIPLPLAVRRRPMLGANYIDGWLHVRYGALPADGA